MSKWAILVSISELIIAVYVLRKVVMYFINRFGQRGDRK